MKRINKLDQSIYSLIDSEYYYTINYDFYKYGHSKILEKYH